MNYFLILILIILIIIYIYDHFKRNKLVFNYYNIRNELKKNKIIEKYGNDMIDKIFSQSISYLNNEPIINHKINYKNMPIINIYHKNNYEPNLFKLNNYYNNITVHNNTSFNDILEHSNNSSEVLYCTDSYDYYKNYKNYNVLTICSIPKQIYFISKRNISLIQTNNSNNIIIGALDETSILLAKSIIKSQINYQNLNNYIFTILKEEDIINDFKSENSLYDMIIYFGYEESRLFNEIKKNKFYIIPYSFKLNDVQYYNNPNTNELKLKSINVENSLNKDLLKFYIPFYRIVIKNIKSNKDNRGDVNNIITETIEIDMLLFTLKNNNESIETSAYNYLHEKVLSKDEENKINDMYLYLLNYYNQFLKINYYMQYFEFINLSKKHSFKNQKISFNNLIETFSNSNSNSNNDKNKLLFEIDEKDIIAFNVKENNEIIQYKYLNLLSNDKIKKDLPIQRNDRLYYEKGLGNFKELNKFYVYNIDNKYVYVENKYKLVLPYSMYQNRIINMNNEYININYNRIKNELLETNDKVFVYFIKDSEFNNLYKIDNNLIKYSGKNIKFIEKINSYPLKYQLLFEKINIKKSGVITTKKIEKNRDPNINFLNNNYYIRIDNIDQNISYNNFDPSYQCYEDNTILTKAECISNVDKSGNNKPSYHWDKPCIKNTECPFYLSNKNYKNERGGCNAGFCELPLGLKRTSYKTYDKNITENNYPRCKGCGLNDGPDCCEKQKLTNKSKTPDYIFNNDQEDRRLSIFK
jgi:hypothetical protein